MSDQNFDFISNWNQGNFQLNVENTSLDFKYPLDTIFFIVDSFIQLSQVKDAENFLNHYFSNSPISNKAKIIKNILQGKIIYRRSLNYDKMNVLIKEIYSLNPNLDEWLFYNFKTLEALSFYLQTDFNSALGILKDLECKFPSMKDVFTKFNYSYYYALKGGIELKLGDKHKAIEDLTISESINTRFNNKFRLATDYFAKGLTFFELGEILKAIFYLEKALEFFRLYNDTLGEESVLYAIAEIKFVQGKYSEAMDMLEKVLNQFELREYQLNDIYYLQGKIYQKRKDFENAKLNYENAIKVTSNLNIGYYLSVAIVTMIDLLIDKNENDKIEYYNNLLPKETKDQTINQIKLMIKAMIYQTEGKFEESKNLWYMISNNSNLTLNFQLYALENALKLCLIIWNQKKYIDLLEQIQSTMDKYEKLALDNCLMGSLLTIYLLKAKFFLAIMQIKEAKKYLEEGIKIADKYEMEYDKEDVRLDKAKLEILEGMNFTNELLYENQEVGLKEMLEYLRNVKTNLLLGKI